MERQIIPLCADGSTFDDLGVLLGVYQAVSLETSEGVQRLIDSLSKLGGRYAGPQPGAVAAEIKQVLIDDWRVHSSGRPWLKIAFNDYFLAWDGPLEYFSFTLDSEIWTPEHHDTVCATLDVRQIVSGVVESRTKRGWSKLFATDCRTWRREVLDDRGLEIMVRPRRPTGTSDDPIISPGPLLVRLCPGSATIEKFRTLYKQDDGRRALECDDFNAMCVKMAVERIGIEYYECDMDYVHFRTSTRTVRIRNQQGIGYILRRPGTPSRTLGGFRSERATLTAAARYFDMPALAEDMIQSA